MSSEPHGLNTLDVEVTNVSRHGIWMLVRDRELFMSYEDFPWFKEAPDRHGSQRRGTNARPLSLARTGHRSWSLRLSNIPTDFR